MTEYKMSLLHGYTAKVNCESPEKARQVAEFYLTDPNDASNDASNIEERLANNFSISSIDLEVNESTDCELA